MADEKQNVFVHIGSEYYTFTAAEKRLADYILSAQDCISRMSISELANACSVADATVSRFCRRLGYKSYPDFKIAIANASAHRLEDNPLSGEITREDTLETISQKLLNANTVAMTQTLEVLNLEAVAQAASILRSSTTVLCMGQGGSMLIASEAAHLFSTISGKFRPVSDSHMQAMAAAMMEPMDTILFYSYSGSTLAMLDTLKTAKERGSKVILVTRFPNSPGAALADIVLQCGANENPLQSGSVPARIAQMYLTDILFSEYTRRNLDEAKESRNRIAQALAAKHV
ncbi:MAG: MurR/RpiR family transcriptional regulator [Candidatus Faecousia sp.]|nr:MurR/RpiR family transcriptional regulator [Candidatus Faecousia sp.]